jgi:pilus assembly protein CpaF
MSPGESILSCIISVCFVLLIFFLFKERLENDETADTDIYSLPYLCGEVKNMINEIINMDIGALNLNKKDFENRRALKRSLSDAIRKCAGGNVAEKMIVFSRIKGILAGSLGITEEIIDRTIPFSNPQQLSPADQFEILMYLEKCHGNHDMFRGICLTTGLDKLKKDSEGYSYSVTEDEIAAAYNKLSRPLSYDDKLNILTQRIYEETYGLSVVDLMIMEDNSLDSISGGVSGITKDNYRYLDEDVYNGDFGKKGTHESIWIIYGGKAIHLKFLSFKTKSEMIRILKIFRNMDT